MEKLTDPEKIHDWIKDHWESLLASGALGEALRRWGRLVAERRFRRDVDDYIDGLNRPEEVKGGDSLEDKSTSPSQD